MSFFASKLFGSSNSAAANGAAGTGQMSSISGAETIERLCDRVQSASLLDDRRESLRAIKSLSKKYKLEVGTQAMPLLVDIMKNSRMDSELCGLALDILYNVTTTDKNNDQEQQNLPADITSQFTEMFIKDTTNVSLIFELLDEFDFQIRWSTIKVLNALVQNQPSTLQDCILQIPRGVAILMDLLTDSREIIRNDAILLLNNLTSTNANIQKIVAFESGFDRILEIIDSEGGVDGGIVVEDCFNLLLNLLEKNFSNQNFFKEAHYIKVLSKYLDFQSVSPALGSDSSESATSGGQTWTLQKTTNLSLLLRLIRSLVAPNNQHQIVADCQKAFNNCGLLHRLCAMVILPGLPAELLSEGMCTVGEIIRGNTVNQNMFAAVMMQSSPPRPIIHILILSMITEKQPFHLRCSILYCFQCYLYKNERAQYEIIGTLLPQQAQQPQSQEITIGALLCQGLFVSSDFVSNWLCAIAIAHIINDKAQLKEQLLRVTLAISKDNNEVQSISLLQQCMVNLINSVDRSGGASSAAGSANMVLQNRPKFQTTVSIMMLLSTWLANCPMAVNQFLSQPSNVTYLISQASSAETDDHSLIIQGLSSFILGLCLLYNTEQIEGQSRANLKDTIRKRISIEQFESKLEYISQHEVYSKTLKKPTFAFKCKLPTELLFDYEFTRLFKLNETLIINLLENKNQVSSLPNNANGGQLLAGGAAVHQSSHQRMPSGSNYYAQANGASPDQFQMYREQPSSLHQQQQQQQTQAQAQFAEQQNAIIQHYQQMIREQDAKLRELSEQNQVLRQKCSQLQESYGSLSEQHEALKVNAAAAAAVAGQQAEKRTHPDILLAERLLLQAKISELEVKNSLLEEKCSEQEDEISRLQRERGILQETFGNLHIESSPNGSPSKLEND